MLTTLLAAAGDPNVKEELLNGKQVGDRTYKVHLDGYDLVPALKGEAEWPRKEFIYWTDDGSVAALRYDNWKVTFLRAESRGHARLAGAVRGTARAVADQSAHGPVRACRGGERHGLPALVHRAHVPDRAGGAYVGKWLQSFREFPPRQKPGSFNLDRVMEAVTELAPGVR